MIVVDTDIVFFLLLLVVLLQLLTIPVQASQAAGQETLIGIVGKDFILLGADSSVSQGIALTASNLDKIAPLVQPFPNGRPFPVSPKTMTTQQQQQQQQQQQAIVAAAAGDAATSDRIIGMLQAYATIHEYEAGVGCDVKFVDNVDNDNDDNNNNDKNNDVVVPSTAVIEPGLTVEGMAYLARSQLAAIRPQANVCLLIAGMMLTTTKLTDSSETIKSLGNIPSFISHQVQQQVKQAWNKDPSTALFDISQQSEEDIPEDSSTTTTTTTTIAENIPSLQPHLYWLDELGSLQKIQYGAHGLGSNFCLSILDQGYHSNMSLEEATKLMRDCFQQLRTRFLINSPQPPCIKCINEHGIRFILR